MKNILSKENIKFLKSLGEEIKNQDKLGTAKPVFWQIREFKYEYGYDVDFSDNVCVIIGDDYTPLHTVEDAKEFITYHYALEEEELDRLKKCERFNDILLWCDNFGINCIITGYKEKDKKQNMFLTKKACEQHIKNNSHHYEQGENTQRFCNHAWRNPELSQLLEIVEKFAGLDIEDIEEEMS